MRSILRNLSLASAMLAAAALTATSAMAEPRVNVPFSFSVAGKDCPAGVYSVERNPLSGVVTLRSADATRAFSWITFPGDAAPGDTRIILRFDDNGTARFLHSVQYGSAVTARLDRHQPEYVPTRIVQGQ